MREGSAESSSAVGAFSTLFFLIAFAAALKRFVSALSSFAQALSRRSCTSGRFPRLLDALSAKEYEGTTRNEPDEPDALDATGEDAAELGEGFGVEVLLSDAGDEDRLGLSESRVLLGDEEVLAEDDKGAKLALEEVEDVDCWRELSPVSATFEGKKTHK